MNKQKLKELILEELKILNESNNFITEDGKIIEYGSQDYIDIFEGALSGLTAIRKNLPYRKERKERDRITKCIESLRYLKNKAKKSGIKSGLLKED